MVPKHFSENNPCRTCLFFGCLFANFYWILCLNVLILATLDIANYLRSPQSLDSLFIYWFCRLASCCNMDFVCYQKLAHSCYGDELFD